MWAWMNHTKPVEINAVTHIILMILSMTVVLFSSNVMASGKGLLGYVMQVQMTPAVCALDKNKARQRKCLEGYALTIQGLIPETTRSDCTTKTSATLPPLQKRVVARVMPDEQARIKLWATIGGCVPMDSSQYFRKIINLADQLKVPDSVTSMENRAAQITTLRSQFVKLNPKLPKEGIEFNCNILNGQPVLTDINICYQINGQFKKCPEVIVSSCPANFNIEGSY